MKREKASKILTVAGIIMVIGGFLYFCILRTPDSLLPCCFITAIGVVLWMKISRDVVLDIALDVIHKPPYKNLLTVVLAIIALVATVPVLGQNFVEDKISFDDGSISHSIDISVGGPLYGKLGWYFWSCNSKDWSEAYPGLTFSPFSWVQLGAGYGVESGHGERLGSMLWLGKGRFSAIGFWEKGASYWHRIVGNVSFKKGKIGVGFMNETLLVGRRTGPRLEATYGKFRLWGSYMGSDYTITGVNLLF